MEYRGIPPSHVCYPVAGTVSFFSIMLQLTTPMLVYGYFFAFAVTIIFLSACIYIEIPVAMETNGDSTDSKDQQ